MAERGAFVTHDGETVTDARTLARQIGLLRAMAKHDLHRVVTFHSRIDYASRFALSLLDTNSWLPARRRPKGTLWTDHVSGRMTAGERDVRLRRLRTVEGDERGVLTNARCLNEGVDLPTLDGVAFIDPRRSQVDVVQAVGRAIRKAENKTIGTVVIPVFVDENADPEQALESGEFDRVWQVVKALRAHDDVLADELDELRRELGRRKTAIGRPGKIRLDLPSEIGDAFARAFDTRLIERSTSIWEEGIAAASAYRQAKGHLRVPARFVTEDGLQLGAWINSRRMEWKRGTLSQERVAELDALGMTWEPFETDWQDGIAAASAYRQANGDLRVPARFVTGEGFPLGGWISNRRIERTRGTLSPERVAQLDALGMVWEPWEEDWQQGIAAASVYRQAKGHLRVPQLFVTEDGFRLGGWISNRRAERRRGTLSPERIVRLDALGIVWDALSENWKSGIAAASVYRRAHGHLRVPRDAVIEEDFRLGDWINRQRVDRKLGTLSLERIAQLDALGMVWDYKEEHWQQGIATASAYRQAKGHLRVPYGFVSEDGFRLGTWISVRRSDRRRGTLSQERVAELDALGMTWEPFETDWQDGIAAASAYRQANGDLRVPARLVTEDGFRLGRWISKGRTGRTRGTLSPERVAQLDALGMVWEPWEEDWQQGIAAASVYRQAKGHLRVPQLFVTEDGFRLGTWISSRRLDWKRGTLSPERVAQLDALGMVWDAKESLASC